MNLPDLKKLCDEATAGPWVKQYAGDPENDADDDYDIYSKADPNGIVGIAIAEKNAAFIAAARTYLPRLIAVAEAAKAIPASVNEEGWHGDLARALAALEAE